MLKTALQRIIFGAPFYRGPGDIAPGATAWVSCARAYNRAAAQAHFPIMDLVDQAGANLITIYILKSGFVDVQAINNWVSANSVTTIKLTKLYDQTGNGLHFTQATLASMPALTMNSANGLPGFLSNSATNSSLATAGSVTIAVPFSLSACGKLNSVSGAATFLGASSNSLVLGPTTTTTGEIIDPAGNSNNTVGFTAGAFHSWQGTCGSGASALTATVDGSTTSSTGGSTGISTALRIGRGNLGFTPDGIIMEGGFWPYAFTAAQVSGLTASHRDPKVGYNF